MGISHEQLGLRFRIPGKGRRGRVDRAALVQCKVFVSRNHGQDFVTLTIRLNSGRFGIDKASQIPLEPTIQSSETHCSPKKLRVGRLATMNDELLERVIGNSRKLRKLPGFALVHAG